MMMMIPGTQHISLKKTWDKHYFLPLLLAFVMKCALMHRSLSLLSLLPFTKHNFFAF